MVDSIKHVENVMQDVKLLMVGAGGIGCELLKNLVLTGFTSIHVIDLDTIDVSNLNRQFLFQRKHVGMSKAVVAKESVLRLRPNLDIKALHDSVMSPEYNVDFFTQFDVVLNALDNKAARNHVNRMCLAADRPLIESGTSGYLGQVTLIKKGRTECYECQPKPAQKTFPGCTIRNTPSEPVHCIVWAKHLFNQLFGDNDEESEVSPDTGDPEVNGGTYHQTEHISTHKWAREINFDAEKLFMKLFHADIKYLLSMDKLWQKRKAPSPLSWSGVEKMSDTTSVREEALLPDKHIWSVLECRDVLTHCIRRLSQRCKETELVWDKDDDLAMDFVAAAANIRAYIFHIPVKSRFDIKSISGNIIPAIATTNAIIAGLMVVEMLKVLSAEEERCRTVYLNKKPKTNNKLLVPCQLEVPNPKCYVCAKKPEVVVYMDVNAMTVKQLEDKVFKEKLCMIAPDVEIDDGKGTILISSEEGETEDNWNKSLAHFKIANGTRLKGDDFLQNFQLIVTVRDKKDIQPPALFLMKREEELEEKPRVNSLSENGHMKRKFSQTSSSEELLPKKLRTDDDS